MIQVKDQRRGRPFRPLEEVRVELEAGSELLVSDGAGRIYRRLSREPSVSFSVAGALGSHHLTLLDRDSKLLAQTAIRVETETFIDESSGRYGKLLAELRHTMQSLAENREAWIDGRIYSYFVAWLRDHTHVLKGMKWFSSELKSAVELYAHTQRDDGMVFDNIYRRQPAPDWEDHIDAAGGYIRHLEDGTLRMRRIQVEADVEYLFVEALYYTWKATGDDQWMASLLEHAVRALRYSLTDPVRYSSKYGLVRRAYTIDTWDFMPEEDTRLAGWNMVLPKDQRRFGIMHGDNTGTAAACAELAEMLQHVGRADEAEQYRQKEREVREALDRIAWNGRFFTHHVPEDPGVVRDLGVDESSQVSLSNAYALNRGIRPEQAQAIIETYTALREELPEGHPGPYFAIWPPFGKGFGADSSIGEYMNAGVLSIVAGELSRGCFLNGYEREGVRVLADMAAVADRHHGYLPVCLRGVDMRPNNRTFTPLGLEALANTALSTHCASSAIGWVGEGDNDLRNHPTGTVEFHGIPFAVAHARENQDRVAVGISENAPYLRRAVLPVHRRAASVYLLHTSIRARTVTGILRVRYADGDEHVVLLRGGQDLAHWWMPRHPNTDHGDPTWLIAWEGPNPACERVATSVSGLNLPHPDKDIASIELESAPGGDIWMVLGFTLCDTPRYLPAGEVSFGIPDNWGAAAVTYGLLEGLVGIVDDGVALEDVTLAPRWPAATVDSARACAHYPASGGYVAYDYAHDCPHCAVTLRAAGNGRAKLRLLLPEGARGIVRCSVDGNAVEVAGEMVRQSLYACMSLDLRDGPCVVVEYSV